MGKLLKRTAAGFAAAFFAFAGFGCSGGQANIGGEYTEKVDENRTQLYVYNYNGGYGTEWLVRMKESYEELHKEDSYEKDKKGIQIMINPTKTNISSSSILGGKDEIYFTENVYYYSYLSDNAFADITPAVTGENPYETDKKVVDKFSESQKAFYGVGESGDAKYYGVPHYSGAYGLVYDVDLFESKGYYFIDGYENETELDDKFVYLPSDERSAGPDGVKGTSDDGLPATYEDFFDLCEYISQSGDVPVSWTGTYYQQYLGFLINALAADYEGLDQMMLNYSFDGTAEDLVKTINADGSVDLESLAITEENGYELHRQAGRYYALKFAEQLIDTDKYHNSDAFTNSYTHTDNQTDFLMSANENKKIAMTVDGMWWQSEAKDVFSSMASRYGSEFSQSARNLGWMPLPKATEEKVGTTGTMFDCMYSLCFVKANIASWKLPIAIDFIQYVNTDEALVDFTLTTNTMKSLDYQLSESELGRLTPYGRSLVSYMQNADIVYPYSDTAKYVNNQSMFRGDEYYYSKIGNDIYSYPANALHVKGVSAKDYFNGLSVYYRSIWSTL